MPTFETADEFDRDYSALTAAQRRQFLITVAKFRADLPSRRFRKGLRVKAVLGQEGMYEMTWAPDGRATFRYGTPIHGNDPHVIWLRVGTHNIFRGL
jgi:hypothetical protein